MDRVCIFIEGSNFYFGLKRNNYPTRVDYYELAKALTGPDRQLIRTYYYNSAYDPSLVSEQSKTQKSFYDSLLKTPFLDLRLGHLVPGHNGNFKQKVEKPLLAGEMVYFAARNFFDTAMVITEDSDYSPVLTMVKELGKSVEICFFKDSQPLELVRASDRIFPLQEVLEKVSTKIFQSLPDLVPEPEDNIGNRKSDSTTPKTQTKAKVSKTKKLFDNFLTNI